MATAVEAWERYAAKVRPRRVTNSAGAITWFNWTQYPDHGPNESLLGDIRGKRVLELGSGSGANLAHLATLGAHCVGVDLAPSRRGAGRERWGHLRNLEFVVGDVLDFLPQAEGFDVIYSVFGAVWFVEPAKLLPLVHSSLREGGVFAFSHLPPGDEPEGPTAGKAVTKWHYSPTRWVELLARHGFQAEADVIPAPVAGPGTMLVRALS